MIVKFLKKISGLTKLTVTVMDIKVRMIVMKTKVLGKLIATVVKKLLTGKLVVLILKVKVIKQTLTN